MYHHYCLHPLHTHMSVCINYLLEYPQLHIFYNFKLLLYIQLLLHVYRFRLKMYFFPRFDIDGILRSFNTFPEQHNFLSDSHQCQDYAQQTFFPSPIEDSIFINWCKKLRDRNDVFRMSGEYCLGQKVQCGLDECFLDAVGVSYAWFVLIWFNFRKKNFEFFRTVKIWIL
jgi:hypothetical protein